MNWGKWIRQAHRWLSITFTVLVAVNIVLNFVAPGPEQQPGAAVESPKDAALLYQVLLEGGAEFIAELISGQASNVHLQQLIRLGPDEAQRYLEMSGWEPDCSEYA